MSLKLNLGDIHLTFQVKGYHSVIFENEGICTISDN